MRYIAVDAMGSEGAPDVELDAAVAAAREGEAGLGILLCGDAERLSRGLAARGVGGTDPRLKVHHAGQIVTMDDAPAVAVRQKRDSSMRVAFERVKADEASAVLSAGNSGAMLACATLVLGRLPGVQRPAIVTTFPTVDGACVLCDMGANVDPRPETLAQFGVLGAVYAEVALGRRSPRVGLLSNGTEAQKGTELTRQAHALLARMAEAPGAGFVYAGYVEGRDIFTGRLDVVATDGFTGNVVLKTAEGAALTVISLLRESVERSVRGRLGGALLRPILRDVRKRVDYVETGGAPLLGADGLVTICHGASTAPALKNAILSTWRWIQKDLKGKAAAAIARQAGVWSPRSAGDDPVAAAKGHDEG